MYEVEEVGRCCWGLRVGGGLTVGGSGVEEYSRCVE